VCHRVMYLFCFSIFNPMKKSSLKTSFFFTGNRLGSCVTISFATLQSLYPIVLIVPAAICVGYHTLPIKKPQKSSKAKATGPVQLDICQKMLPKSLRSVNSTHWITSMANTIGLFFVMLTFLLLLSYHLSGGWDFLHSVYGFMYVLSLNISTCISCCILYRMFYMLLSPC